MASTQQSRILRVGLLQDGRILEERHLRRPGDLTVGRDTTNRSGGWRIVDAGAKGRYYAKLLKRIYTEGDAQITCKGARSGLVQVS